MPHQRCLFHKSKNSAAHLQYTTWVADDTEASPAPSRQAKQAYKQAILADAAQIYDTDVEVEIRTRAQVFQDTWQEREPKAVEAFMNGFELTLRYLSVDVPRAHVSLIRTTNLLERFHKDIRRKQKDIGMFQSDNGCEVFWYLMATRETAKQRAACRRPG